MPVAVRPLESASEQPDGGAEPEAPEAASIDPVARLSDPPPPRPAEASGQTQGGSETSAESSNVPRIPPTPARPAAGPRVNPLPTPSTSIAGDQSAPEQTAAAAPRFRTLADFAAANFAVSSQVATVPSVVRGISTEDRRLLQDAANLRSDVQGVLRIVAHGGEGDPAAAASYAVRVAEVLVEMGVPTDRIFAGADNGTGPVEVFLSY